MNKKLLYAKSEGQSIPLMALILVVLFGMAALALDVGNTYAEQREVVRATNAAALEAMDAVRDNFSDAKVRERIYNSLQSHNIPVSMDSTAPGMMQVEAYYFEASGKRACDAQIGSCANINREKVDYVRVAVDGQVDTYFARLLGRPDLPVNAVAHAGSSICREGMYPIAIKHNTLDEEKGVWLDEDRKYKDDIYRNLSVRRVKMTENNNPGNFNYTRWNADPKSHQNSAEWLADALIPPGDAGDYQEAAWPDKGTNLTKPAGYPIKPREMSPGDWIAGNPGLSNKVAKSTGSNKSDYGDSQSRIDYLISKRVILNLPLYDDTTGEGSNAVYHLSGVGAFLLIDYGHNSKDGWYMDLAYIGKGAECVGLMTGTVENRTVTLEGNVSLYPHYIQPGENKDAPVQLLIVLDVSGSMKYNFAGEAHYKGEVVQCQGPGAKECLGPGYAWNVDEERRINIAIRILKDMVMNNLRPIDRVRIITFHGKQGQYPQDIGKNVPLDIVADNLTTLAPPDGEGPEGDGWTNDRNLIIAALNKTFDSTFVSIEGETPGSVGLARAIQVYRNSNPYIPGTTKPYKRSVIFMTDGFANVTRSGMWYRCTDPTTGSPTVDNDSCQSGRYDEDGYLYSDVRYPLDAMNEEGFKLSDMIKGIENGRGNIHSIALGPTGGLIQTTLERFSANNQVAVATNEASLRRELTSIFAAATTDLCQDAVNYNTNPTSVIELSNLPLGAPKLPLNDSSVVGYVKLKSITTNWSDSAEIRWDDSTKQLSYRMEGIPPGEYTMTYWMLYKGPDEEIRYYDVAVPPNNPGAEGALSQSILLTASTDVIGSAVKNLVLDMNNVNICASEPPTP